jgi:hypothetical protein
VLSTLAFVFNFGAFAKIAASFIELNYVLRRGCE